MTQSLIARLYSFLYLFIMVVSSSPLPGLTLHSAEPWSYFLHSRFCRMSSLLSDFPLPRCIQLTWPCFRALTHCPHLENGPEHLQAQKPVLSLPLLVLVLLLFCTLHTVAVCSHVSHPRDPRADAVSFSASISRIKHLIHNRWAVPVAWNCAAG